MLRRFAPMGAIIVLLMVGIGFAAFYWARAHAAAASREVAAEMARTHSGLLASELQKFRLLPLVLTEYPDARAVLERSDAASVQRLNGKLELLARRTDAAAIYVIGKDGVTLAASNWRLPTSFVGHNYGFRPYFRNAMRAGDAELFALGTVSGRPGLFIARAITAGEHRLGVIVVKVEFDRLERGWARQEGTTFVTDGNGVVLVTSRPEWRFLASRPLSSEAAATVRRTLQFGIEPLRLLPFRTGAGDLVEAGGVRYVEATAAVPLEAARLHYLQPLAPALASANARARTAVLSALILAVIALALLLRTREKRLLQVEAQRFLETQVALRTSELRETNARLTQESLEREKADARYRAAREELAQANRLSSIGQIIAGVVHEINQPVAAIRTFADNAGRFLDRGRTDKAKANLDIIGELTARIGAITAELRSFARRKPPLVGAVAMERVIDGALLLVGDRMRAAGVQLEREGDGGVTVLADQVRLEQVLVNLLQNAIDATAGQETPRIRIAVRNGTQVETEVADNGPGIDPAIADELFTPFVTGREEGLGLGLGIARDIAREFGGELEQVPSPLGGAAFRLSLRPA